jgi:hypothetical protein
MGFQWAIFWAVNGTTDPLCNPPPASPVYSFCCDVMSAEFASIAASSGGSLAERHYIEAKTALGREDGVKLVDDSSSVTTGRSHTRSVSPLPLSITILVPTRRLLSSDGS